MEKNKMRWRTLSDFTKMFIILFVFYFVCKTGVRLHQ